MVGQEGLEPPNPKAVVYETTAFHQFRHWPLWWCSPPVLIVTSAPRLYNGDLNFFTVPSNQVTP